MRTVRKTVMSGTHTAESGLNTVFVASGAASVVNATATVGTTATATYNIRDGANASLLRVGADTVVNFEGNAAEFEVRMVGRTLYLKSADQEIRIALKGNHAKADALQLNFADGSYKVYNASGWKMEGGVVGTTAVVKALAATAFDLDSVVPAEGNSGAAFPQTYSLTPVNTGAVSEGGKAVFELVAVGGNPDATGVAYTIGGVQAGDVVGGQLSGTVDLVNGRARIEVNLAADALTEGTEVLSVTVGGRTAYANVSDTSVTPEVTYALAAAAASVNEGAAATFTLTTTGVADGTEVDYLIQGVTSDDITGGVIAGKAIVNGGVATITVNLADDTLTEGAETLKVSLANGQASAQVNVADTSLTPPVTPTLIPTITVGDVTVNEADGTATITVTLSHAYTDNVGVSYATADGVANAGADYTATTGTLVFAPGEISKTFTVAITDDATVEADETFAINLSSPVNAVIGDGAAVVTITSDDVTPPAPAAPVIGSVETALIVGGSADHALSATVTVVDAAGFNGGSVTISADNGAAVSTTGLLAASTKFYLIGNSLVAQDGYGAYTVDTIIGSATVFGGNVTINFTDASVTAAVVQDLLRDLRVNADDESNVTVSVTNALGATATFTRAVDPDSVMTLAGVNNDSQEVQLNDRAEVNIDVGANADLTLNGAATNGMVISVTGATPDDVFHFNNLTQTMGAAGTVRLIGNNVVLNNGGTEVIVGTVSGNNTNTMTVTLNAIATEAIAEDVIQAIQATLTTAEGNHAFTLTVTDGQGQTTVTATSSADLVGNFVNTALTAVELADVLGGTAMAPYTITGNTYVNLGNDVYGAPDVAQLIADGKLIINGTPVIRFVMDDTADISGIVNLNALGNLSFGNASTPLGENLTLSAAQAHGRKGNSTADVTVNNVQATPNVDLSNWTVGGTKLATATLTANTVFTGDFGDFSFQPSGAYSFTLSAAQADGRTITGQTNDAAADIIITGVDGNFDGDLRGVTTAQTGTGVVINFTGNTSLHEDARIDTVDLDATVAVNSTLTLNSTQATQIYNALGNSATITGADATAGTTGGSIVVTALDNHGDAGNQLNNIDLRALSAGGDGGTGTAGTVKLAVNDNFTITGTLETGTATIEVASAKTLTASAALLDGETVAGAGNVAITALHSTLAANLSGITASGTRTAAFGANGTFTGNLGTVTVNVAENVTMQLAADKASGKTIVGAADTAAAGNGGSILVTGLGDGDNVDFSNITAGGVGTGDHAAGTFTVVLDDENVDLHDSANLGTAAVVVDNGRTLTLTAAQATGRSITDGNDTAHLVVEGLAASTNLTGVNLGGNLTINVRTATVDASAANLAATTAGTDTLALYDADVTLTAAQAAAFSTITGADDGGAGGDDDDSNGGAGTGTEFNDSVLRIAGNVTSGTVDLTNVNANANMTFGNDGIAVSAGATLIVRVGEVVGSEVISGAGTVRVVGVGASSDLSSITATTVQAVISSNADIRANSNLGTVDTFQIADGATLTLTAAQASVVGRGFEKVTGGTTGAITVSGTSADETLNLSTASANVNLNGGSGDDQLTGGTATNALNGGSGDDVIFMTYGTANNATGGVGSDNFVFGATSTNTVNDFKVAEGDVLNFSSILTGGGSLANSTTGTTINLYSSADLDDELWDDDNNGVTPDVALAITVGNNKAFVAQVADVDDINSAAGIETALDTGVLSAVDVSANAKAVLILSGANNTNLLYVYQVVNDADAAVIESEITLIGTVTTDSTTLTTGNIGFGIV